jgi:hypothetical protein
MFLFYNEVGYLYKYLEYDIDEVYSMNTILKWITFESMMNAILPVYGRGASKIRFKLQDHISIQG